jgi:hypothetical protein
MQQLAANKLEIKRERERDNLGRGRQREKCFANVASTSLKKQNQIKNTEKEHTQKKMFA